jgi:hypothetical protein
MKARATEAAAETEAAAKEASAKAEAAAAEARAKAEKAAAGATAKAASVAAKLETAGVVHGPSPANGNIAQWAKWLADQLRHVPDIQVYDALRLSDLTTKGPAGARAVWATAQNVLGKDYGAITIGDLLKRFV